MLLSLVAATLLACARPAPPGPPPVVLVSLDTMRADHLGTYGSERALTPNLDRFASQAVVFDHAYAQANETVFSHASLFSGRYPSELGEMTYNFRYPADVPTLPEIFRVYGYRTGAVVSGGHLDPVFGLGRGFEHYRVAADWGCLYHAVPGALQWLDDLKGDQPWLLMVHGYDAHARYLKPTPLGHSFARSTYRGLGHRLATTGWGTSAILFNTAFSSMDLDDVVDFRAPRIFGPDLQQRIETLMAAEDARVTAVEETDIEYLRGLYAGAVAYADTFFGLLLAGLQERDVLDRAWIVVFSDHGESLGEHGFFNHRYTVSEEDTHVILMIRPPGGTREHHVPDLVGLVDLLPTLLEIGGGMTAPAGTRGISLVPAFHGDALAPRGAVFTQGVFRLAAARSLSHRMVFNGVATDSPFFSDLLEAADLDGPAFSVEPEADLATRTALRALMVEWSRSLAPTPMGAEQVSPALLQALQERGYWGHP